MTNELEKLSQNIEESFKQWEYLREFGGSDPFWEDGVNMNLVRNHILHYRSQMAEICKESELPDIYKKEVPPEVNDKYMANAEKIRETAIKSLEIYKNDSNFKRLAEIQSQIKDKNKKQIASNILGYVVGLEQAINNDNLLTMRRHQDANWYLRSPKDFLESIQTVDFAGQVSML